MSLSRDLLISEGSVTATLKGLPMDESPNTSKSFILEKDLPTCRGSSGAEDRQMPAQGRSKAQASPGVPITQLGH